MMIKENLKQEYSAPALDVLWLEMEQGIAAGSARVVPPNSGGQVQEEWTQDPDDNRTIEW
ncbi:MULTISPECIES: hypothetical protein [Elizabethkingia]|uniref:Uncharacterized protein n=2 Tax=Elizabethkingia TaxID=308865 RepID=A0ABD5B7P0_ELIMR|nr:MULTISPECIES: hypothetical protein [Elizabethkingia]AQX51235.1 hypothetical protein AYC66_11360 [Elizabethkingia anophelis]MCT4196782.1 hypothetical protein [Elizabethkingia anophelis]MCT4225274.1 hypothetical protein [Elizabethkingia anophelis]MCT4306865.1 hypothetical protein [Elizabethkingia anophelis]MDQ8749828.1 hypothetical protein [Elizabethkingia miricola]